MLKHWIGYIPTKGILEYPSPQLQFPTSRPGICSLQLRFPSRQLRNPSSGLGFRTSEAGFPGRQAGSRSCQAGCRSPGLRDRSFEAGAPASEAASASPKPDWRLCLPVSACIDYFVTSAFLVLLTKRCCRSLKIASEPGTFTRLAPFTEL